VRFWNARAFRIVVTENVNREQTGLAAVGIVLFVVHLAMAPGGALTATVTLLLYVPAAGFTFGIASCPTGRATLRAPPKGARVNATANVSG
jgi:hypothetical protein